MQCKEKASEHSIYDEICIVWTLVAVENIKNREEQPNDAEDNISHTRHDYGIALIPMIVAVALH